MPVIGQGSLATSGNSHALRIDKAFVRDNPVLSQTGLRVRFKKIADNTFVFFVLDPPEQDQDGDTVVESYLAFLESDMRATPSNLAPIEEAEAARLEELVRGITVEDADSIPVDVSI